MKESMKMRIAIVLVVSLAMVPAALAQVNRTAGAPDPCRLFKPAEIARYLGEPVEAGEADTLVTGCSWYSTREDSDSFAMLNIWPKGQGDAHGLDNRREDHPEVGDQGFAIKDANIIGSWTGGVMVGEHFYRVVLVGPRATRAQLLAWLKQIATKR
jgi:hypothetical protein